MVRPALVAVALSASGQLLPARFQNPLWVAGTSTVLGSGKPVVAPLGDRAIVAFRTAAGALRFASMDGALTLVVGDIATVANSGPFLAPSPGGVRVGFTDGADTLATALLAAGSSAFGPVSALTTDPSPPKSLASPAVASTGSTEASVHAGTNEGVYFAPVGGVSEPVFGAGGKPAIGPTLVFDAAGRPVVFFVRNTDSQVFVTVRKDAVWTTPVAVATDAFTDRSPSATVLGSGALVVVWHGAGNQGIYLAQSAASDSGWGTGRTVEDALEIASSPVVVANGPTAEILFVRGGVAKHGRLTGSNLTVSAAFGTGLSEVGAASLAP